MEFTSKLLAVSLLFVTLAAPAAQPPAAPPNSATAAPAPAKHSIGKVNKQLQAAARKKPKAAEQPAQVRVAK
jgi:hypothetical protein